MSTTITNTSTSAATDTSALASATQKSLGKDDFLQLLTTQLRQQDPLNPMNDRDFIAQMAQISTLDSTQAMSTQLSNLVTTQQRTQALQLVGREVDYQVDGESAKKTGNVTAVLLNGATPMLLIDGKQVPYSQVQSVR